MCNARRVPRHQTQAVDDLEPFDHIDGIAQGAGGQRGCGGGIRPPPQGDDRVHADIGERMVEGVDELFRIAALAMSAGAMT